MQTTKSISEMANGAFQEIIDAEMCRIIDNILDPNTSATAKRKLTVTFEFTADDGRSNILVKHTTKCTFAPKNPQVTSLYIAGEASTGEMQIVEMTPQLPGQVGLDGKEQDGPYALRLIRA
jgi:hypothetical protein